MEGRREVNCAEEGNSTFSVSSVTDIRTVAFILLL